MKAELEANIVCWLYEFKEPLATILAAITVAILAPLIGLFVYHRQKESELVRARYLDNGLDVISKNAEYALGIFRHNWSRGLTALKLFRDAGKDMPESLYSGGYVELDPAVVNMSHGFLLNELLGDNVVFEAQQYLYAFVYRFNAYVIHDLGTAIRVCIEEKEEDKFEELRQAIVEKAFEKMEKDSKSSFKYYKLLEVLHEISIEFSRRNFQFETVDSFRERSIVKERIKILKEIFSEGLLDPMGQDSNNAPQPTQ